MRGASLAAALLVALAASVRGDEIVLKSGRTVTGSIVKEDDQRVTIEVKGGATSIPREQIETIRRAKAPVDPPPATSDAPKTPSPAADGAAPSGSPRGLLAELDRVRLEPWEHEPPSDMKDAAIQTFKIVSKAGTTTTSMTRPKPDDVAALYMASRSAEGRPSVGPGGEKLWYWLRLYWNDEAGMWGLVHPAETRFLRERESIGRVADLCCKDETARVAAERDAAALYRVRLADRAAPAAAERAKLREDCAAATGSKDAGECLAQFHELCVEVGLAARPSDKVAAAMKRRDVVRRLVETTGR